MNPYASELGQRSASETIAGTWRRLREIAAAMGPDGVNRSPAPGKWSAREIFCHLADAEIAFAFRLRQILAEDDHVIQPWDQEKWAAAPARYEASDALAVFGAVRGWNSVLIESLTPEQRSKTVTHPERGTMTFQTVVETMAGHDLNHLKQLERMADRASR